MCDRLDKGTPIEELCADTKHLGGHHATARRVFYQTSLPARLCRSYRFWSTSTQEFSGPGLYGWADNHIYSTSGTTPKRILGALGRSSMAAGDLPGQHRPGPARLLSTVPVRGSCKRTTVAPGRSPPNRGDESTLLKPLSPDFTSGPYPALV